MPNHIAQPAIGAPYNDCIWNVSQRNAPGAINAIAFEVRPVSPSVALLDGLSVPAPAGGTDVVLMVVCPFLFFQFNRRAGFSTGYAKDRFNRALYFASNCSLTNKDFYINAVINPTPHARHDIPVFLTIF
jgi:hypothetical protein